MNIREIAKKSPRYFEICREERNYAAIFFAALCNFENAKKFIELCGCPNPESDKFGVYFEYAYLRDLWNKNDCEDTKKEIIRKLLPISNIDEILQIPIEKINEKFGVAGTPSKEHIQFPGNWAITKYDKNFPNDGDFLKICRFKWSFNIKPDIVIHLDENSAICIEAKYTSSEGSYPASEKDKKIFHSRGIDYVGQMDLQRYMMEDLLGINTKFVFLVQKKKESSTHQVISWAEVFELLDMNSMPNFAKKMIEKISA